MQINDFYEKLVGSCDVKVTDNGLMSLSQPEGDDIPCMIDGKRLALPLKERLRDPDDAIIFFHPLSENVLVGGESPVLKKLKMLMKYRLNSVASVLMYELMALAVDKDQHRKFEPKQHDLIAVLNQAVPASVTATTKFLEKANAKGETSLVSIYLKNGGQHKGNKYSRLAVTSFPPLKDFERDDKTVFGVELGSKRDKTLLKDLFLYIFEDAEKDGAYSFGSNDMAAPHFHALANAYVLVAERLNKVTKRFSNLLSHPDRLTIDLSWAEHLEDLPRFRDKIPPLEGNEGNGIAKSSKSALAAAMEEDNHRPMHNPDVEQERVPTRREPVAEAPTKVATAAPRTNSPFKTAADVHADEEEYRQERYNERAAPQRPMRPEPRRHDPRYDDRYEDDRYEDDRRPSGRGYRRGPDPEAIVVTENGALDWDSVRDNNVAVQATLAQTYYQNPNIAAAAMGDDQPYYGRGHQQAPAYDSYYNQSRQAPMSRGGYVDDGRNVRGGRAVSMGRGGYAQRPVHGFRR